MARLHLQLIVLSIVYFAVSSGLFSSSNKKPGVTKYILQQKVFSIGSSYTIEDEKHKPVFKVGFKKLGLGQHLRLTDVSGKQELYSIKHIVRPLGLAKYEILQNDQVIAEVDRKMNLIGGKKFVVNSKDGQYRIEGNFNSREFKIKKDHLTVATISKKLMSIGDKYSVKIEKGFDHGFILAMAIVVDEVAHD